MRGWTSIPRVLGQHSSRSACPSRPSPLGKRNEGSHQPEPVTVAVHSRSLARGGPRARNRPPRGPPRQGRVTGVGESSMSAARCRRRRAQRLSADPKPESGGREEQVLDGGEDGCRRVTSRPAGAFMRNTTDQDRCPDATHPSEPRSTSVSAPLPTCIREAVGPALPGPPGQLPDQGPQLRVAAETNTPRLAVLGSGRRWPPRARSTSPSSTGEFGPELRQARCARRRKMSVTARS